MEDLRIKLIEYMGEHDLTLSDIAKQINRTPLTVWNFIRGKTKPHDQTLYKIKKLIEEPHVSTESGSPA